MNTFPLFLLRAFGIAMLVGAPLAYLLGNSAAGFFAAVALLILGTVLLIIAEHAGNRLRRGSTPVLLVHTIDIVYFIIALPFVLAVLHDYVLCPLFPSLGLHGADSPTACTIGWFVFALFYILPSWILITLSVVPFRLRTLLGQGKSARLLTILYVIACGVPLVLLVTALNAIFF